MPEPGAEGAEAAQVAAMFVGNEVVGIVGARAVIEERADGLAVDEPAGQRAVAAVAAARRAREHRGHIRGG